MPMIFLFVLPGYGFVFIDRWAVLDLSPSQIDQKHASSRMKMPKGVRRNKHQPLAQPAASVRDQIPHCPLFVIDIEIANEADFAVISAQFFSVTLLNAM